MTQMNIPSYLIHWFQNKNWTLHSYQKKMFSLFQQKKSVLLIAPTGGGKTMASFLPILCDIHSNKPKGLHTLYISPLKALTNDIQRNLKAPIVEMGLTISIDTRTGDTSSYRRSKQQQKPPSILLTTPESLMLLLSYKNAPQYFAHLQTVIIDELHSFVATKRGDLLSLGLAQLNAFAPAARRIGLSATVAKPEQLALWLGQKDQSAELLIAKPNTLPDIELLNTLTAIPYSGYMAKYAIDGIYQTILEHQLTIIFVNTRAQAEFIFQQLWQSNSDNLPIAIYHGSLSKEQRAKAEDGLAVKMLKKISFEQLDALFSQTIIEDELEHCGACYWPQNNTLIVADLHFEKGSYFALRGQPIPLTDTRRTLEKLKQELANLQPETVICLGDNIHDANGFYRMHEHDLLVLQTLQKSVRNWLWIMGNHDKNNHHQSVLEPMRSISEVHIDNVCFSHELQKDKSIQIIGHYHPKISIKKHGLTSTGPCFLVSENTLIMPAFGSYTGGLNITNKVYDTFLVGKKQYYLIAQDNVFLVK